MNSKYKNGMILTGYNSHIRKISAYNHNYYIGLDKDLLFGLSDDDDTTEWFLINPTGENIYLGESRISNDDKLEVYEKRPS